MGKKATFSWYNVLYWLSFCLCLINCIEAQACKGIDQCSCMMPDGKIISLWDIDKRYTIGSLDKGYTYPFQPCKGLSEPNSDCNGAVACQVSSDKKTAIAFKPAYVNASKDIGSNLNKFVYKGGQDVQMKKAFSFSLLLECAETIDANLDIMFGCGIGSCITKLTSKCACPGHCNFPRPNPGTGSNGKNLSTGSILCIILLVLLLVYIIGGVAINKFALNKEGSDVIPQKTFWSDMPSLVKDGVIYSYQKVHGRNGDYEKI